MLIITGTGRSGTGMLARLFGGHHEFRAAYLLDKYLHEEAPSKDPFSTFEERLRAVLDLLQGIDPHTFVDASNLYIHLLDAVWALYPQAKILLGVRNGHDFARSSMERGWHERETFDILPVSDAELFRRWPAMTPVERVAWIWVIRNEKALGMLSEIPKEVWRIVRIERLDQKVLADLEEFGGHRAKDPGAVQGRVNAGVTVPEGHRGLSREDRETFDGIAGELMRRLGYPTTVA